jgi:RNA polymerase sigma-70 factor (ECF subfamily)
LAETDPSPTDYHLDPDVVLMLRVCNDDAAAFEQLVDRYKNRLLRIMQSWTGSKDHAEDLAQEVFLRVYRSRKTYKPTAKFSTWLFKIANNVASNAVRDRARRKEYQIAKGNNVSTSGMVIENIALAGSGSMPTRKLDKTERAAMVQQAVNALGERQRMALLLCKFEGLSYQEIADTMDLSVKAVKSLLSRARANLKLLLMPYMEEGSVMPAEAIVPNLADEDDIDE